MEFNSDEGEVLHSGKLNQGRTCTVNGIAQENVEEQGHLGVQAHSSLKVASQVDSGEGGILFGCLHSSGHCTRGGMLCYSSTRH